MGYEDIIYKKEGRIARITINRPERHNSFSKQTIEELIKAFEDAGEDSAIGVIVITGAGDKAFCAGGYIPGTDDPRAFEFFLNKVFRLMGLIRSVPKPVIAAVNGYCVGGGNELQLWCDLTIASENARFGQAGPKVGSSPLFDGTQGLPRLVGEKKAKEMVFLCQLYTAKEAEQMGLINKAVPKSELYDEVDRWCERLLEMSPQSLRLAKLSLNSQGDMLFSSLRHGHQFLCLMADTDEFREGISAFMEKRAPDFNKFRK